MAQRQLVQFGCDLEDGKVTSSVQTVAFGYGGGTYELELCSKHRKPLSDLLAELAASGRKVGAPRTRSRGLQRPASHREENAEIRKWAAANGIKVSGRGRIAASVIHQFHHRGDKNVVTLPTFRSETTEPAL